MDVLRLHGVGDLRLHSEPEPVPGPGESLLRVTAVGVCGSDVHWLFEGGIGDARVTRPLVLGHEFSAVVESGELQGQRVAVDPAMPCGTCELCQLGHPNLCAAVRFAGHGAIDGALREYVAWPNHCLYPLPDSVTSAEGALLEPMGVAMHAVGLGGVKPGATVGVFGCGPIGLLVLQMARAAGATQLLVTDKLPHRLEAARSFGADVVLPATDGSESAEVLAATNGRGVDVAFEAAGENEAVEVAIEVARPGARVVLIGIPADDRTSFNAATAREKGLTIMLSRRMKHTYPRALRLVEKGLVDLRSLVTHRFPLAEYEQAFSYAQRREGLKAVIEL